MTVKLLTEHHLESLSLTRGCRGLSESTLVKKPHCWKSRRGSNLNGDPLLTLSSVGQVSTQTTNSLW